MKKTTSRKTARSTGRATRNRSKRPLAQFKIDQVVPEFRAAFEVPPAEYDIDAVEAHVNQVFEAWRGQWGLYTVESKWSSRLKAYALAWAMGLNELADPEGGRCEHLTMDSFEAAPDPYDVEFKKLASSVTQEFARLARIPAVEQDHFLLNVTDDLATWIWHIDLKNNDRELLNCLEKTKHSAAALYRDLDKLRRHLQERDGGESYRMLLLMPSVVSRILHYLPAIIDGIRLMMPTEWGGRPRGRKEYPGLADLVCGLEFSAQLAGGGFGIPNKKLKKGRLIEALDWFKAFLADNKQWSWLAQFLPTPEQHPVSAYEGVMMGVYKLHMTRVETKLENESQAKVENIDPAEVRRMRAYANSMRYIIDG